MLLVGDLDRPRLRQPPGRADPAADPRRRPGRAPAISTCRCRSTRSDGDLGQLGETFNKMTDTAAQPAQRPARRQRPDRRAAAASSRRCCPASRPAVIGIDDEGTITVAQPARPSDCCDRRQDAASASRSPSVMPELAPHLGDAVARPCAARAGPDHAVSRDGRERIFNVRVTSEQSADARARLCRDARRHHRPRRRRSAPPPGPTSRAASPTRSRTR